MSVGFLMVILFVLFLVASYAALLFVAGRYRNPCFGPVDIAQPEGGIPAAHRLRVTTWNIGFAALGKDADFILDHGKHLRALTRDQISEAAGQIGDILADAPGDAILLQEVAQAGFLTRGVPVARIIANALPAMRQVYWADFAAPFAVRFLRVNHGMAIFARGATSKAIALKLSPQPMTHYGFLKKYYAGLVQWFPIQGTTREWVVVNLHLSAFDASPEAKKAQVKALFQFATGEHAKGNPVIIGGDWNMQICEAEFPHDSALRRGDCSYEFPLALIPEGWQRITDARTPTVRSMQEPYVDGRNHTMIIDGFIVSPGVAVDKVITTNLGFGPTDHHPVSAVFSFADGGTDFCKSP